MQENKIFQNAVALKKAIARGSRSSIFIQGGREGERPSMRSNHMQQGCQ
jgi:hypothetical protein